MPSPSPILHKPLHLNGLLLLLLMLRLMLILLLLLLILMHILLPPSPWTPHSQLAKHSVPVIVARAGC